MNDSRTRIMTLARHEYRAYESRGVVGFRGAVWSTMW